MLVKADILLLDEPTNHLDHASVAWLKNYLKAADDITCMIVSHDIPFLDEVSSSQPILLLTLLYPTPNSFCPPSSYTILPYLTQAHPIPTPTLPLPTLPLPYPYLTLTLFFFDQPTIYQVITDVIHYEEKKLVYYHGNMTHFVAIHPEAKYYYELQGSTLEFKFPIPG